jgi:uncharacterized protein YwgA
MNRIAQQAVLAGLAERLTSHGSWTGETHIQKAAYLASTLADIDFDFDFILYKHGPFSFELRDELNGMRAEGLMEEVFISPSYGPRLMVTDSGRELEAEFAKTMGRYGDALDWVADALGNRGVMDLERLATAMWVTQEDATASTQSRAEALCHVKPHITREAAVDAVEEVDGLLAAMSN